jgi:hypothetical protein
MIFFVGCTKTDREIDIFCRFQHFSVGREFPTEIFLIFLSVGVKPTGAFLFPVVRGIFIWDWDWERRVM